jgi:hypothetical protein
VRDTRNKIAFQFAQTELMAERTICGEETREGSNAGRNNQTAEKQNPLALVDKEKFTICQGDLNG